MHVHSLPSPPTFVLKGRPAISFLYKYSDVALFVDTHTPKTIMNCAYVMFSAWSTTTTSILNECSSIASICNIMHVVFMSGYHLSQANTRGIASILHTRHQTQCRHNIYCFTHNAYMHYIHWTQHRPHLLYHYAQHPIDMHLVCKFVVSTLFHHPFAFYFAVFVVCHLLCIYLQLLMQCSSKEQQTSSRGFIHAIQMFTTQPKPTSARIMHTIMHHTCMLDEQCSWLQFNWRIS